MARDLNGTTDYTEYTSIPGGTNTVSFACWFQTDQVAAAASLVGMYRSTAPYPSESLRILGNVAGDPLSWRSAGGSGIYEANATGSVVTGEWMSAGGYVVPSSGTKAFLNGVAGSVGSANANSGSHIFIYGNTAGLHDGRLVRVAAWNVQLTDAEFVSLARGFPPKRIRPQSLLVYIPLIRDSNNRTDRVSGLVHYGTVSYVDSHPRSYGA